MKGAATDCALFEKFGTEAVGAKPCVGRDAAAPGLPP
jgi:hypothetical protein